MLKTTSIFLALEQITKWLIDTYLIKHFAQLFLTFSSNFEILKMFHSSKNIVPSKAVS